MEIICLGVGSSTGTPVLGCTCPTCSSDEPRNKRTRCSTVVRAENGAHFLIDTGPDLRLQALRENILWLDAVLYTHNHADHMNGIDDLRNFCYLQKTAIPIYGNRYTVENTMQRFGYAFAPATGHWDKPVLTGHVLEQPAEIAGIKVTPVPVMHGKFPILAYRIGDFAYITDVSEIPDSSLALLQGLKVLFLDCLHYTPHPTHINFEQALEYAQKIGAEMTYFIHMTHRVEYHEATSRLPDTIRLAYDGMRITL